MSGLLALLRREPTAVISTHDAAVLREYQERHEQMLADAGILGLCHYCSDPVVDRGSAILVNLGFASAPVHAQCWVDEQERVESRYRFSDYLDGQAGR